MNDQFESEIDDLIVAKLRNSPAIAMARVSRLDLAHFDSQPDSPRLIQRFPKLIVKNLGDCLSFKLSRRFFG